MSFFSPSLSTILKRKKKENSCKKNAEGMRNGLGHLGIGHDTEESS